MKLEPSPGVDSTEIFPPTGYPLANLVPNWVDHLTGATAGCIDGNGDQDPAKEEAKIFPFFFHSARIDFENRH